ncbi:MAG TPA: cytochrome P450 [Gemmataceae bacterium]|jgi:cytochrome P450|nr:cytochrome P450 [Gemmataceae bacterium]
MATRRLYPPGPRDRLCGLSFYGPLRANPLGFVERVARGYGDFAFLRVGWVRLYLVNRPVLIREVLTSKASSFRKLGRQMKALRKIEGDGLVVSEGQTWTRHRPIVQGSFHARHFHRYASVIVEFTRRRIDAWTPNGPFDLAEEMNELALQIIAKVVFDTDVSGDAARLRAAVHDFRTHMQREANLPLALPDWLPLPGKLRQRRAVRAVDDLIWSHIRQRRNSGVLGSDMLGQMLAAASSGPSHDRVNDAEVRDEAATLFVAGHDTTSAALAWFWYVLAGHPEVEHRVLSEVDGVLDGRPATGQDAHRLRYLEMVVKESMRLYPAAGFLFGREVIEDVELGGHTLRRGSWVLISPYIVHRNPQNFPQPDVCDPERFAPGRADTIAPYSYIPFGGGPRTCIGNSLALTEAVLLAATILQRFRLVLDQGEPEMQLEVVLRPKGPLRMRALPRRQALPAAA